MGVMMHAFNPGLPQEAEAGNRISEFNASLIYRESSRAAGAIHRNLASK